MEHILDTVLEEVEDTAMMRIMSVPPEEDVLPEKVMEPEVAEDTAMMRIMSAEPEEYVRRDKIMEPADAAYMAAQILPGAGIAESPKIMERLKQGKLIDAFLYTLGVAGDLTYVAGPLVGATIGTALKFGKVAGLMKLHPNTLSKLGKFIDKKAVKLESGEVQAHLTAAKFNEGKINKVTPNQVKEHVETGGKGYDNAAEVEKIVDAAAETKTVGKVIDDSAELTPKEIMYASKADAEYKAKQADEMIEEKELGSAWEPPLAGYDDVGNPYSSTYDPPGVPAESTVDRLAEGYYHPSTPSGFKVLAETKRALIEGKEPPPIVNPKRSAEQKIYKGDKFDQGSSTPETYTEGTLRPYVESKNIRETYGDQQPSPFTAKFGETKTHAELQRSFISTSEDPLVSLFSFSLRGGEGELGKFRVALKERMFVLETVNGVPIKHVNIEDIGPDMYRFLSRYSSGTIRKATKAQRKRIGKLIEARAARESKSVAWVDDMKKKLDEFPDDADLFHADIVMNDLGVRLPKSGIGHLEDEVVWANPEKMKFRRLTDTEVNDLLKAATQSADNHKAIRLLDKVLDKHGPDVAYNVLRKTLNSQMGLSRLSNTPKLKASFDRLIRDELYKQRGTIAKMRDSLEGTRESNVLLKKINDPTKPIKLRQKWEKQIHQLETEGTQRGHALNRILDDIDVARVQVETANIRGKKGVDPKSKEYVPLTELENYKLEHAAEQDKAFPKYVKTGRAKELRQTKKMLEKEMKAATGKNRDALKDDLRILNKELDAPQTSRGIHADIGTMNEGGLVS